MGRDLTPKQARFVDEYLIDLNATQAAVRAGYSARTADKKGPALIGDSRIATAIEARQAERSQRTQVTSDRVLAELAVIGFSDPRHYRLSPSGGVELADGAPDYAMRAVASVKHRTRTDEDGNTTHEVEYRLWDKNTALANIGKHLGMFTERHEITGKDGGPIQAIVIAGAKIVF